MLQLCYAANQRGVKQRVQAGSGGGSIQILYFSKTSHTTM